MWIRDRDGSINSTVAKEVFEKVFEEDIDPEAYVTEHGLKTVNDAGALEAVSYTHLDVYKRQADICGSCRS